MIYLTTDMQLTVFEIEKKCIFFDEETEFKIMKLTNKMQLYIG